MPCYVANALGDSEEEPSHARMLEFLESIDPLDLEHGAAWLTDNTENSLEFNGDGTLVFSRQDGVPRHIAGVSKQRALELWVLLARGDLDDLEKQPWQPGLRPPLATAEAARRHRDIAEWQLRQDREFYDLLGPERLSVACRKACGRGCISHSVFCRPHHFESVRGRPCPFDD